MDQQKKLFHVQWFEHSSKTILEGISDPRELFLCNLCGEIELVKIPILGKVSVYKDPSAIKGVNFQGFFCRYGVFFFDGPLC